MTVPGSADVGIWSAALGAGLLFSAHCVGMCGGFVAAYSAGGIASGQRAGPGAHILFNAGRLVTFSALGALSGAAADVAELAGRLQGLRAGAALLTGVLMILFGLGFLGLWPRWKLENEAAVAGSGLFRGGFMRALRSRSALRPLGVGLMVGFLPCGALWNIALMAASAPDPAWWKGALTLACYAVGTTPALFAFGLISTRLSQAFRTRVHRLAALVLVGMGAWAVVRGMAANGWL